MARIKVTVERIDGYCDLPVLVGDHFFLDGSKLTIPNDKHICMWALYDICCFKYHCLYIQQDNLPREKVQDQLLGNL